MCFNMLKYIILIFHFYFIPYSQGQLCPNNQYNGKQQTKTSSCMIWGDYHLKTYDDHGISFKSSCKFTMTSFMVGISPFRVEVGKSANPCNSDACYTYVEIRYGREVYKLTLDGRSPVFSTTTATHQIPVDLTGISVYRPGNRVFVDFTDIGVSVRWNMKDNVQVVIDNNKSYRVSGLCGNNDKCSSNDQILNNNEPASSLEQFLKNWQTDKDSCPDGIKTKSPCDNSSIQKAESACQILKDQQKFGRANEIVNPDFYIQACTWDYCSCKLPNPTNCLCGTLDAYAKTSVSAGVARVSWRDAQTCPLTCPGDLRHQPCAPNGGVRTCGSDVLSQVTEQCEEGCYCFGTNHFFEGKCYVKRNCPCRTQGKVLQAGETTSSDCNTCTCTNGKLDCTDCPCWTGTCWGDPHYTTFDGRKYDFMGRCVYYLVKTSDFSIEADQYGYFNGQFLKNYTEGPSYAKAVFIRMEGQFIESKEQLVTQVNGVPVTRFPHKAGRIIITKPCDQYILVYLPNNVEVQWDGNWLITVRIPRSLEGQTMGLLGTFNEDPSDDFITPDGELVEDPTVFGNSWKTEYSCRSEPETPLKHPCDVNPGRRAAAEKGCSAIKSEIFKNCNASDPQTEYENCVYDACYYDNVTVSCCKSLESFADECGRRGISVNWRESVPECKITCPAGLEYKPCSNGCTRTCEDIALRPICANTCIEGCNCPDGKTLDEDGHCIPVEQCKCRIGDAVFPPGFQYLRNEEELLTCKNARWILTVPTEEDLVKVPYLDELNKKCASTNHSVFTACKYPKRKTCQNMHNYQIKSIDKCEQGCECIEGYVYDTTTQRCVKPEDCPCYYQGQSYEEGSLVKKDSCTKCICRNRVFSCEKEPCEACSVENEVKKKDCNTCTCRKGYWDCTLNQCCTKEKEVKHVGCEICTCKNGVWHCDNKNCPIKTCDSENEVKIQENGKCVCRNGLWRCIKAQCDLWGSSNIKTFDGVLYGFQGECSYALTQGKQGDYQFNVIITNERCTHEQATCLKQVRINTHTKNVPESITLVKDEDLPNTANKKYLLLTDYISFVTVDYIGAGVRVFWDKKTWVYVQIDSEWKDKLVGLCGNYNNLKNDDLVVKGKEVKPNEAYRYVSLWVTSAKCKTLEKRRKPCNNERTKWAEENCNILLSGVFSQCHARVPVTKYYEACVTDTCTCEIAGDCECFCTALSVYAQQCRNYGIHVNWRSHKLCPIQCLANTYYQSCVKFCPPKTCATIEKNLVENCEDETCVETCAPKYLPTGYVYTDSTYGKIVPETSCTAPRCIVGGSKYYDQDITAQTLSQLRYCSHGKEVCVKLPTCPKGGNSGSGCSCTCPLC